MGNTYNLKNEAAKRDFSLVEIAELSKCDKSISQDIITDLTSNPGSVLTERAVKFCDLVGINPGECIVGLSENTLVQDGSLENNTDRVTENIRKKAEVLTDMYDKTFASCQKISEKAENVCRRATIMICGQRCAGKFSMAANLLGREFTCAGPSMSRNYKRTYIISETCAGIEFGYTALDGFIYECTTETEISLFMGLSKKQRKNAHNTLGPGCYGSMNNGEKTYIIFSSASALNHFNVVSCNLSGDEKEADLISSTDIMVILLSENAEFLTKLTQLLHSAWEKWGEDMINHIILAIPKSDRYITDDTDIGGIRKISEVKAAYADIIKDCLSHFCTDAEKKKKLEESLSELVVPYSSIYKNITTGVSDASHNFDFYNALDRCVRAVRNEMALGKEALIEELETYTNEKNHLSAQQIDDLCNGLNNIFSAEAKNLRITFKSRYKELMDAKVVAELIKDNGITRSKEGRHKALAVVNSRLTDLALEIIDGSLLRIYKKIINMKFPLSDSALSEQMARVIISGISKNADSEFLKSILSGNEMKTSESNVSAVSIAAAGTLVAAMLPMASLLGPIAGVAGTVVSSYYAQTNFEKNTARKIVSAYDDNNVCDKLTEKIITSRFIPVQNEVFAVAKSFGDDEKMHKYAEKLLEVLKD